LSSDSGLREAVSTALGEFQFAGVSIGHSADPAVALLESVTRKLKAEMVAYDSEAVVVTLSYVLSDKGKVKSMNVVSADCSVFYPSLCLSGGALRGSLEEKMKQYLADHLVGLTVREADPFDGRPVVVTLPGRLVGISVRMQTKGNIWRLIGLTTAGSYVDIVSPRQEVAF
jgi:hypothetical protein